MKKRAFTLIEVLVVIIIVGTLSATILPRVGGTREEAKKTMSKVDESRKLASEVGFDGYTFSSDYAWGFDSNLLPNGWEDLKICDPNDSEKCIIIMDRNLWASKAGIICNDNDTWACGYHFQWWNNYWFSPFLSVTTGNTQIPCSNPFSSNVFIIWNNDYCETKNDDLWWGRTSTSEAKRWPCPNGYHVPSVDEWNNLMNVWAWMNVWWQIDGGKYSLSNFQIDLKMPFAGRRGYNGGSANSIGNHARLWSSSTNNSDVKAFYIDNAGAAIYDSKRANGISVRCFKN